MEYKEFKEIFCDILPIIERASPLIGSLIGSPATGTIIGLLGAIAGENPCNSAELANKLKNDHDLYAKLVNLEATHGKWISGHK